MNFTENQIFHIYNQGNNKRQIFFHKRNYYFFLRKAAIYLLPYGDLISYCLMPNHFHFQLFVQRLEINIYETEGEPRKRLLNDSIGIMLRSYTRAINKEKGWSGSLFRNETKAKDGWEEEPGFITVGDPRFYTGDYANAVFDYVHQNPVEAGLTTQPEYWEFSSAREYFGHKSRGLCNKQLALRILGRGRL